MTERYDYAIVTMGPDDDPDQVATQLNNHGAHGYQLLQPVTQGERVVYTLVLREEVGE